MKRWVLVVFAVFLAVLPLMSEAARAQSAHARGLRDQQTAGTTLSQQREVVALRTENSRTYEQNGRYVADLYPGPVNYRDSHGAWQPIDNTLVPSSSAGYESENKANRYTAEFPSNLSQHPVRIELGTAWIAFAPRGITGTGTTSGNTITYPFDGGSIAFTTGNAGVKEALALSAPTSPHSFVYDLQTSPDLTARQSADGGIDFVDTAGTTRFSFQAPTMDDSATVPATSHNVAMTLDTTALGDTVTVTANDAWLTSPDRRYPVVIDPTVTFPYGSNAAYDCGIWTGQTIADCSNTLLTVGNTANAPYNPATYRAVMIFDGVQTAIPRGSQIQQADLSLYFSAAQLPTGVASASYTVYNQQTSWATTCGGPTWDTCTYDPGWVSGGNPVAPSASGTFGFGAMGWRDVYPTALVQDWMAGSAPNNGFLIKNDSESGTLFENIRSLNYTDSTYWPRLQVIYNAPTGMKSFYTAVGGTLDDRIGYSVNIANGNLLLDEHDLRMQGVGLDLGVDRFYNSSGALTSSDLGYGWLLSAGKDVGLTFSGSTVDFNAPGGAQYTFQPIAGTSNYTSPPGIDAALVRNSDGTYTLTDNATAEKLTFNVSGQPTADTDRVGNHLSYAYTTGGVSSITDTQNRQTTFTLNGYNFISQMHDPAGRTYGYGYDGSENLTTYTDPNNQVTRFAYDGNHRLTQVTTPASRVTTFTYDSSGRVATVTRVTNNPSPGSGATTTFAYFTGNATTGAPNYTVVTDPNNHATTYYYDGQWRVTSVKDPLNNTTSFGWTADNHLSSARLPSGASTNYGYDSLNNLTQVSVPVGYGTLTASCQYSNSAVPYQPSSCTDVRGNSTSYAYTAAGLLQSVTDASNHSASFTYNANGTVASETDENNHTTNHTYLSNGMPNVDTPPAPLGTTGYTFDSANRESTVTDGNARTTSFTYDALDRVTSVIYSDSSSVGYAYDADGNVLSMTDATGTSSYSYDAIGNLIAETNPTGATVSCPGVSSLVSVCYQYDLAGNLLSKTDSGGTVSYGYDSNDEVTSVHDRQNNAYTIGYDHDGNQTSVVFPNGVTQSMSYNSAGQLTRIGGSKGSTSLTSFTYNYTNAYSQPQALPLSVTDVSGNKTSYTFDNGNRLTQAVQTNSGGSTLASYGFGYDPAGNLTSKSINGTSTTFSYNAANELTAASGGMSRTYTYDGNGDRTGSSDGMSIALNPAGQITSITPPGGSAIPYTYKGIGEQQRIGAGSSRYQYDGTGLNKQSDTLGDTYFTTLPDGTLLGETVPSGTSAGTYYYLTDGQGSVAALTDSTGTIKDSYTYDPLGNMTSSGSVPNPFTFQGGMYDSQSGYYYTGSGYYDPANGQSFGCQDRGWVDPGEDLCGEDESHSSYCENLLNHTGGTDAQCASSGGGPKPGQSFYTGVDQSLGLDPVRYERFTLLQLHALILSYKLVEHGAAGAAGIMALVPLAQAGAFVALLAAIGAGAVEAYLHHVADECSLAHGVEFKIYTIVLPFGGRELPYRMSYECLYLRLGHA